MCADVYLSWIEQTLCQVNGHSKRADVLVKRDRAASLKTPSRESARIAVRSKVLDVVFHRQVLSPSRGGRDDDSGQTDLRAGQRRPGEGGGRPERPLQAVLQPGPPRAHEDQIPVVCVCARARDKKRASYFLIVLMYCAKCAQATVQALLVIFKKSA